MLNICLEKRDSLNGVLEQFKDNRNIVNIHSTLSMNFQNYLNEQRDFTMAFIEKWPSSLACLYALYQQVDQNTFVLYKDEDFKYFAKVDSILSKTYPDAPYVKSLHSNVEQMLEQQKQIKLRNMLSAMGAKAPEIALPSPTGDIVKLSSTKGKVVLLDFWASWNQASRDNNAKLLALYKKYKYKGFEIYQISLDQSKDAWLKAIKEDGVKNWIQVSDLKYLQSPVVSLYNVDQVPASFLIDKEGILISKDLKDIDLENKLIAIFSDDSNSANK
jgi:peroxiredoxin